MTVKKNIKNIRNTSNFIVIKLQQNMEYMKTNKFAIKNIQNEK